MSPSSPGANEPEISEVNTGQHDAVTAGDRSTALVPAETIRGFILASHRDLVERQELRAEAAQAFDLLKERARSPFRSYKNLSVLFGGISAAALLLGKDLLPTGSLRSYSLWNRLAWILHSVALGIAVLAGVGYWFLNERVRRIDEGADELKQALSIRSKYVAIIDDLVSRTEPWTLTDLERGIDSHTRDAEPWRDWRFIARTVGAEVFAEFLVIKGRELRFLDVTETQPVEQYRLS